MPGFWMVRAGSGGNAIESFKKANAIGVDFAVKEDLANVKDRDQIRSLLEDVYPDATPAAIGSALGCLYKIRFKIKSGDIVISYDSAKREYNLGEIKGDYLYSKDILPSYPHIRRVTWKHTISRDDLSSSTRNALGSLLTVFEPGEEVLGEIQKLLSGEKPEKSLGPEEAENRSDEPKDLDVIRQELLDKAHEFIKDRISTLDWEEMQELIAAILRAMGYKTRVSPQGSDRGKDIVASPDGLGLEQPRIKVEVKHRAKQAMGAPEIRSFLGGLRGDDRGLYVSTGGFSTEAMYEAERASVPVTLLNLDDLAALLVQHYDQLDSEGRALVPLTRVFWPAN